jgi:S1-C subfamily serine protease
VVYSKYFAGNTQVPNPAYAEAQRAYMYAQALEQQQATRYQQQLQRYAIDCQNNPYALAPVRPNDWGSILALGRLNRTAAYVEEPVYQDYQLKQNDLVTECRFQAEIRFGNSISGSNLFRVPMEGNQQFRFTETSEVRPNDVKGHANERAPANWAEDCLEKFVNSRLGETPSKVADLYCETVLARALDAIRRGEEQVGVEMALAWAMNSEKCRAVGRGQVSDWFAATEMHDLQNRFDNACFGAGGASLDGLWTNMVRGVMFQLGRVITPRSQAVGEAVSGADPMALRRSQTVLTRPTHDMSNRFLSVGAKSPTARMHATPSIAAVLRVTVTVFTDRGSGSGFVVSTNGFVVSNYHVIEGAKRVLIAGYDGKKTLAEVVDFNASRDLAILKVTEGSWTAAQLGDVDGIGVGDTVYAIGSPGGSEGAVLDQTVTRGIISGIRDFPSEANSNIKIEYIQTDAAINAGNSGGPLVNEAGKVVGVNTQKLVGRGVEGLNFSMSINEVKKLFFRYLND